MRPGPCCWLVALALLCPAGLRADDDGADASAMKKKQAEAKSLQEHVESLSPLGTFKADDVFQLRMEGQHLVLRTALEPGDRAEHALAVEELPGPASISIRYVGPRQGARIPLMFQFHRLNTSDPKAVFHFASLYSRRLSVQLSGDFQFPSGSRSVQLIDDRSVPDAAAEAAEPVHLYVKEYSNDDEERLNFSVGAKDLKELARRHPREVHLYLLPLMRDLGAESLLGVDPHVAWQVLAPEASAHLAADAALRQKVAGLVRDLDADAFPARRSASAALKALGPPAAVVLMGCDRAGWTDEQNARVKEIVSAYRTLPDAEAAALRDDADFLLDCLGSADPALRRAAKVRLEQKLARPLPVSDDAEDRPAAIEDLRAELAQPAGGK